MRILSLPITCVFPQRASRSGPLSLGSLPLVKFLASQPGAAALHFSSSLRDDFANRSCSYGLAALADCEPQSLFHSYWRDQLDRQRHVVAGHHHLCSAWQLRYSGHVRGAEIELWTVALKERRMPSAFFLGQHINLGLELGVRRDRATLG